jgi:hypothetical protein
MIDKQDKIIILNRTSDLSFIAITKMLTSWIGYREIASFFPEKVGIRNSNVYTLDLSNGSWDGKCTYHLVLTNNKSSYTITVQDENSEISN